MRFRPKQCLMSCAQRLTVPLVDTFIEDLKDSVKEARLSPSGKGTMVQVYGSAAKYPSPDIVLTHVGMFLIGLGNSSAVGPAIVGELATTFLDTLFKA
jgi:sphinganine-1-phosphate aldolase